MAVDDGNGKSDGGGDTNNDGKGGHDSDGESDDSAGGYKNSKKLFLRRSSASLTRSSFKIF